MARYTAESVASAISYDPASGLLFWSHRGRSAFVSDRQYKFWNTKYAGKPALTAKGSGGYLAGKFMGSYLSAHRAAFACMTGQFPAADVDHIDGDRGNNKWANLRSVSRSQNCSNRSLHKNNTSGHVGVSFDKKSGMWRVKLKGKLIGLFTDWANAVLARKLAAELDGGFTTRHGA